MTATLFVSSVSDLISALDIAQGGDTILLSPGDYGTVDLSGYRFGDYVTLKSADPDDPADMNRLLMDNSQYIRVDSVVVSYDSNGSWTKIVDISEGSSHIEIVNSEIHGLVDDVYEGSSGIYIKDASNITLTNNHVHDVGDGIAVFGVQDAVVSENYVDYIFGDNFKFGGVTDILIENNTGGGHVFPDSVVHTDFMQFQGDSTNAIVRGNVNLMQNNVRPQGIFTNKDTAHYNMLIEQNIIYSGKLNAIKVYQGENVVIRDNTMLSTSDGGHTQAAISGPDGAVITGNISTGYSGSWDGNNLKVQYLDPDGPYYYDDFFVNATNGLGVTLEDLVPIEGSLADGMGAHERLMELLTGGDPIPEAEPLPSSTDGVAVADPEPDITTESDDDVGDERSIGTGDNSSGSSGFLGTIFDSVFRIVSGESSEPSGPTGNYDSSAGNGFEEVTEMMEILYLPASEEETSMESDAEDESMETIF